MCHPSTRFPPLSCLISVFTSHGTKGHGTVDVKKPCKTNSNSPALYKGLYRELCSLALSPPVFATSLREREWEAVERYMRRERERSKRVI